MDSYIGLFHCDLNLSVDGPQVSLQPVPLTGNVLCGYLDRAFRSHNVKRSSDTNAKPADPIDIAVPEVNESEEK